MEGKVKWEGPRLQGATAWVELRFCASVYLPVPMECTATWGSSDLCRNGLGIPTSQRYRWSNIPTVKTVTTPIFLLPR